MDFEKNKNIEFISDFFKNRENFKKLNLKNTGNFSYQKNRVIEGIQKLCFLWNYSEKTRIFVLKMLRSFFPFDSSLKVMEFSPSDNNIDVLLNDRNFDNPKGWHIGKFVRLAGLEEIQTNINKFKTVIDVAKQQQKQSIRSWVETLPYEIQHADFAYYNHKKTLYACRESIFAMRKFIEFCLEFDIVEIRNLCIKKQRKIKQNKNKTIGANVTNADDIIKKVGITGTIE